MNNNASYPLEQYNPKKEITFDMDTNKYSLKYDNSSKLYDSNLFGVKTSRMIVGHTGFSSYHNRILAHSMDKIKFKIDQSLYRPQGSKFEGYAQFARPLAIPFTNIARPEMRKYLNKTIEKTKNSFFTPKNKDMFNTKMNQGLDYYTGTLNNLSDNKNKKLFLNRINCCITNENNLLAAKSMEKYEIKSLKNIKKRLLENSKNKICGRKLKQPNKYFMQKFKVNYNVYFRNPIKKLKIIKTEKKDYFQDLYLILNKDSVKKTLNFVNNNKTNIKDNKIRPNIKNVRYIFSGKRSGNANQTKETKETCLYEDSQIDQKNCLENNLLSQDYLESLQNKEKKFNTIDNKDVKLLFSYDEKSDLFDDDDKDNSSHIEIKNNDTLYNHCKLEKKLLLGYKQPAKKKEIILRKSLPKFKPFINTYRKELELYKKVNPLVHKFNEEKEQKELEYLKKQLEKNREISSTIYPRNKIN